MINRFPSSSPHVASRLVAVWEETEHGLRCRWVPTYAPRPRHLWLVA